MKKQDILQFWRDVEIFNLPDFNKDAALINDGDILPWQHKASPFKKNYKWRYTLIFGKIEKKLILNHLNTLLKIENANDWEEPIQGFTCLSALILDEEGRPYQDSYVTASYTFGIKALENKKNLSLVTQYLEQARTDFLERYNIPDDIPENDLPVKGDVVYWNYLNSEISYLKQLSKWWKEDIKIYVLKEEVPKDSEPNSSFLNSFYLDDLNYLSDIKEKEISTTLQQYLTLEPVLTKRKDLIQNKDYFFDTFNPTHLTAGRWPSNIEYGLYAAQTGAVNTIFSNLRNADGLQGVNGPPGTGKTTLLLDVIAEIIVDRAKIISELGCDNLFLKGRERYVRIEEEKFTYHTYNLVPSLQKNFGIVVASNNNAAVENISKELPLKGKIDTVSFPDADYFSQCATTLIDNESWGVLGAALGNSKNRNTFRNAFWLSEKDKGIIGFEDLLYEVYKDDKNDQTDIHRISFEHQNEKFKSLLHDFEEFKKMASTFHNQFPTFIQNEKKDTLLRVQLKKIEKKLSLLSEEKQTFAEKENEIKKDAERVSSILHLHTQCKPSFFFFQKLFRTNDFKKWKIEAEKIMTDLKSINAELEEIRRQIDKNKKETQLLVTEQLESQDAILLLIKFFAQYKKLQDKLTDKYEIDPENLLDTVFYQKGLTSVHLLNPYHSPKIAKLRSDIFIAALRLHHDAILANAKNIKNNLKAYFDMTSGRVKVDVSIAQNLWDTFFLCVPVASTTLASASRLFPNTSPQQVGWLLIDEAGQATPQSAAGLIYRAKRCVIVGDPLQVEPVVTMPEKLVTKLRKEHSVSVDWSPYRTSVQQLADRISLSGTYMNIGDTDQKIWTGFPLRTHRRCDDPMFSIANEIAYSNQMVKAVAGNSAGTYIGPSGWFDVSTAPTLINKHVIIEEVELLNLKIAELRNTGYEGEIYVISPFKSVASYCSDLFRKQLKVSCGTIHTFQGKEADIVFLILGSDPKSLGARNWASQKPNMLNVALTRAKKRFYVIGNKKLWSSCNYFSTMAKILK
ncbi:ATP-binding protein [Flavobacterium sp. IB48]|uniref:DEAD/DEAH box helicase n=1 Tax=Flavobacterium sp. IB48 TaxID=2779375 RepID=UPI0018E86672|nr:ATP-binding protein [Flavobacterium sp. IB48]MBJ2126343.1 ATP-binding protein [Flavobacterium sp. IB48]